MRLCTLYRCQDRGGWQSELTLSSASGPFGAPALGRRSISALSQLRDTGACFISSEKVFKGQIQCGASVISQKALLKVRAPQIDYLSRPETTVAVSTWKWETYKVGAGGLADIPEFYFISP